MKLILRNGRLLASAANRLIVGFANGCGCCGPTPQYAEYFAYKRCGAPSTEIVWVRSSASPPTAPPKVLFIFVNGSVTGRCYCATGESRAENQLPANAITSTSWINAYETCCSCVSLNGGQLSGCQYVPPTEPEQNGVECCCAASNTDWNNVEVVATTYDRYTTVGFDYVQTITETTQRNGLVVTGTRTTVRTGTNPLSWTQTIGPYTSVPAQYRAPACGIRNMRLAALAVLPPPALSLSGNLAASASCSEASASFSYLNTYNAAPWQGYVSTTTEMNHTVRIALKSSGAVCDCNPQYFIGQAPIMGDSAGALP